MQNKVNLLDVVALTEDIPQEGLKRGQVGTVVEELTDEIFEVEFSDNQGRSYAQLAVPSEKLLVLYFQPVLSN
jgi:hypothetical protein